MARFGDKGSYSINNVEIITFEQNCINRRASAETRAKMCKSRAGRQPCLGKKYSNEERTAMSKALSGENCYRAKLTWEIVSAIRDSNEKGTELAKQFSVSRSTICGIRKNKTWKHPPV